MQMPLNSTRSKRIRLREPTDGIGVALASLIPIGLLLDTLLRHPDEPAVSKLSFLVVYLAFWFWTIRLVAIAVIVDQTGIRVVNPRRTWTARWHEIQSFSAGYPEGRFRKDQPVLTKFDGTRIPLTAIMPPQPWTRPNNTYSDEKLALLNLLLRTAVSHDGQLPEAALRA